MNRSNVALLAAVGTVGVFAGWAVAGKQPIGTAEACSSRAGICSCGICCAGSTCRECYNSTDEPWWCGGWGGPCGPGDCY